MQKYLKALMVLACVSFSHSFARAESYVIPFDNNGNMPGAIELVGGDVFVATGTAAIGSTTPVILFGYTVSSDVVTNQAILRDSNTLNTSSNAKLVLYVDANCGTVGVQSCTTKLPIPVIFRNGLSINLSAASAGRTGGGNGRWQFYVRYLNEGSVSGKKPSQVDTRITVDNVGVN